MLPKEEAEISGLYGETDGVKTGVLASPILISSFGHSARSERERERECVYGMNVCIHKSWRRQESGEWRSAFGR